MAEEEKGFVIRDRRRFHSDGSVREDEEIAQPEEVQVAAEEVDLSQAEPARGRGGQPEIERPAGAGPAPEPGQAAAGAQAQAGAGGGQQAGPELSQQAQDEAAEAYRQEAAEEQAAAGGGRALPPVEFSGLVLSLSHAAMMHLGQVPDPNTGQARQDLELARHTIDTLAMLKEKTQGNLDAEEQRLIDHALTELRLGFVHLSRQAR
jgi:hypothetical protein